MRAPNFRKDVLIACAAALVIVAAVNSRERTPRLSLPPLGLEYGAPGVAGTATPMAAMPGPHGGKILESGQDRFEVALNPDAGQVTVYALKSSQVPRSITIYYDPRTSETADLQAVNPPFDPEPMYMGKLSLGSGSFMGMELKLGVEPNAKILKSPG